MYLQICLLFPQRIKPPVEVWGYHAYGLFSKKVAGASQAQQSVAVMANA